MTTLISSKHFRYPEFLQHILDETYIKVKGQWKYLYRAVDREGQTIDFLLTAHRDKKAALRFLKKAVRHHGLPERIRFCCVNYRCT
jgi:putative transposase